MTLDSAGILALLDQEIEALRALAAAETGDVEALLTRDPLDLHIPEVTRDGLTLHDVAVRRTGGAATAEATVDPAQLDVLAPAGMSDLRYDAEASRAGGVVLRGTASGFGLSLPVTVRLSAEGGTVVAVPEGLPIGRQTLFADPRIRVDRLSATESAGGLRVRIETTLP